MIESNQTIIKTVENVDYEIERTYNLNKTINEIVEQEMNDTNK